MKFKKITESDIGSIHASIYELDPGDEADVTQLQENLMSRVKKMQMHQDIADDLSDLLSPISSPEFIATVNARAKELAIPEKKTGKTVSFDVRRSRVTEFMSNVLLEDQYGCVFHEVIDKRLNLERYRVNEHVRGIDVTGLQFSDRGLRFVVCEVKASTEKAVPSRSTTALLDDITKAYGDVDGRLSKEIAEALSKFRTDTNLSSEELANIIKFLVTALYESKTRDTYLQNVIFFPFMVRTNAEMNSLDGLKKELGSFAAPTFENTEVEGVIWAFNKNIDDFCNYVYEQATQ